MSNLGGYQTITTLIKALGGPAKATAVGIGVVGTVGYGVIRAAEFCGKKGLDAVKAALVERRAKSLLIGTEFSVQADGTSNEGVMFNRGVTFTVLEHDEDAIQVELAGHAENPIFVSAEFLSTISDFPGEDQSVGNF